VKVDKDGSVKLVLSGTRKVEAALLKYGFRREDIIVAHPDHPDKVVCPRTRGVGVMEDPLYGKRYGLKLLVSYGLRYSQQLMRKCQNDYHYNVSRMIRDIQDGKDVPVSFRLMDRLSRLIG